MAFTCVVWGGVSSDRNLFLPLNVSLVKGIMQITVDVLKSILENRWYRGRNSTSSLVIYPGFKRVPLCRAKKQFFASGTRFFKKLQLKLSENMGSAWKWWLRTIDSESWEPEIFRILLYLWISVFPLKCMLNVLKYTNVNIHMFYYFKK